MRKSAVAVNLLEMQLLDRRQKEMKTLTHWNHEDRSSAKRYREFYQKVGGLEVPPYNPKVQQDLVML